MALICPQSCDMLLFAQSPCPSTAIGSLRITTGLLGDDGIDILWKLLPSSLPAESTWNNGVSFGVGPPVPSVIVTVLLASGMFKSTHVGVCIVLSGSKRLLRSSLMSFFFNPYIRTTCILKSVSYCSENSGWRFVLLKYPRHLVSFIFVWHVFSIHQVGVRCL